MNCSAGDCSSSESKTASSLSQDSPKGSECDGIKSVDKYSLFQRYSQSGLCQLGLEPLQDRELRRIWDEVEPFSVRAVDDEYDCTYYSVIIFYLVLPPLSRKG